MISLTPSAGSEVYWKNGQKLIEIGLSSATERDGIGHRRINIKDIILILRMTTSMLSAPLRTGRQAPGEGIIFGEVTFKV